MPIYEFFCPRNQRIYSFLARSLHYSALMPRCPENGKWKLEKMLSSFAVTGHAKEPGGEGEGDLDDGKMVAAMEAMEKEFSALGDSDNPEPRALAQMMRRMGELSGEKLPAQMDEVIARLEKGEDPEKLEAEYGDVFDTMDSPSEPDGKRHAKLKPKITRDPTLYEMADYLPKPAKKRPGCVPLPIKVRRHRRVPL